jgi:hypothetical protein
MGNSQFADDIAKWAKSERAFWFGMAAMLASSVVARVAPTHAWPRSAMFIVAGVTLSVGFLARAWKFGHRVWRAQVGKVAVTIAHLFVYVVALAYSRYLVAESLGLPPQDFDVAVHTLTLLLYPFAWLVVFSLLALVVGLIELVVSCMAGIYDTIVQTFRSMVQVFTGDATPTPSPATALAKRLFFRAWSAFAAAILAAQGVDLGPQLCSPLIKWVAYLGDFQSMPAYPGLPPGVRARIHENGIVSIARIVNGAIEISVLKLP